MLETLRKIPAEKVARAAALVCTLLLVALHLVFATHAGALWRDEVNSLEVATMRTFSEMWGNMRFDSFPILFFLLLRAIAGVPASASDAQLRALGCGIGLLLVATLWLNTRWLRLGFPLVSLAVIGFNPTMIRYGDSIRAYGLGIVLMLLSLGAIWRLTESCSRGRILFATLAAMLSVHTLYYNGVLLFAACMGGVAVTFSARRFRDSIVILAVGFVAALSLFPYRPVIHGVQATNFMWKVDFTFAELWGNLIETLGSHCAPAAWLSVAVVIVGAGAGMWMLWRSWKRGADPANPRLLFALVTLLVGVIGYGIFLLVLSYRTRPWYYVVIIAFAAVCAEMVIASISKTRWTLLARSTFALLFVGVGAYPTFGAVALRQTNVDYVAAELGKRVQPGDLIVINTWNYGISLQHYYKGLARCATIPPVEDLRSHRVDLVKEQMMSPAPLAPVLEGMEETLRSGKTIWLVGGLSFIAQGQSPPAIAPGYDGPSGWIGGDFYKAWSEQLGQFVQTHATGMVRIPLPLQQRVIRFENLRLHAISGWRDEPRTARN